MSSDLKDESAALSGLNLDALRAAKRRIDEIGWKLCHNLHVRSLACHWTKPCLLAVF
jgi:hypothetical protein